MIFGSGGEDHKMATARDRREEKIMPRAEAESEEREALEAAWKTSSV